MLVVETRAFTRRVVDLLSDDQYREFQLKLVGRPEAGKLIPGARGLRKLRWGIGPRGKRGGVGVIYFWHQSSETLLLLFIFAKNERSDLTKSQLTALRDIVETEYP